MRFIKTYEESLWYEDIQYFVTLLDDEINLYGTKGFDWKYEPQLETEFYKFYFLFNSESDTSKLEEFLDKNNMKYITELDRYHKVIEFTMREDQIEDYVKFRENLEIYNL